MRFFEIRQDRNLPDVIRLRDFDISGERLIYYKKDAIGLNSSTTLYLSPDGGETAPELIQSPVQMVSDKVKRVMDMYEDDIEFRTVVLADKERETMKLYHLLLPDQLDALSEQSEFYPNGSVKRIYLDAEKIKDHKVFMLSDKRFSNPFVSLEVMESILRRDVVGMIWKEVEVF